MKVVFFNLKFNDGSKKIILLYSNADAQLNPIANYYKSILSGEWEIIDRRIGQTSDELFLSPNFWQSRMSAIKTLVEQILEKYIEIWCKNIELISKTLNKNIIVCAHSIIVETIFSSQNNLSCNSFCFRRLHEIFGNKFDFQTKIHYFYHGNYPKKIFKNVWGNQIFMPPCFKGLASEKTFNLKSIFKVASAERIIVTEAAMKRFTQSLD